MIPSLPTDLLTYVIPRYPILFSEFLSKRQGLVSSLYLARPHRKRNKMAVKCNRNIGRFDCVFDFFQKRLLSLKPTGSCLESIGYLLYLTFYDLQKKWYTVVVCIYTYRKDKFLIIKIYDPRHAPNIRGACSAKYLI